MADSKDVATQQFQEFARLQTMRQSIGANQTITFDTNVIEEEYHPDLLEFWRSLHEPQEAPPPPTPAGGGVDHVELDTGYITFGGGVPVGGYSHLSLFPSGNFSLTGHFHVSGAPSYNVGMVWVFKTDGDQGSMFTVTAQGRVHGTFEPGSRDWDFGPSDNVRALADAWPQVNSSGYSWAWRAGVDINITGMLDTAKQAVGVAAAVIALI